jgi:hypothetical protein
MADQITNPSGDPVLTSHVRPLILPEGLYLFYVKSVAVRRSSTADNVIVPAFHVSLAPGVATDQAELIPGPRTRGTWLYEAGSTLIARVSSASATLLLTSLQDGDGPALDVKMERLDSRTEADAPTGIQSESQSLDVSKSRQTPDKVRRLGESKPLVTSMQEVTFQLVAHLRNHGDKIFETGVWAGRIEKGAWIESFTVTLLDRLAKHDIEYKSLTGNGIETPWIQGGESCGTRGLGIPLVGFALRLKSSVNSARYDCEYSGYFQSGTTIGPLKNGAPCRSTKAADPLEGMQVRIVQRQSALPVKRSSDKTRISGPQFTRLREEAVADRPASKMTDTRQKRAAAQSRKAVRGKTLLEPTKTKAKVAGASRVSNKTTESIKKRSTA